MCFFFTGKTVCHLPLPIFSTVQRELGRWMKTMLMGCFRCWFTHKCTGGFACPGRQPFHSSSDRSALRRRYCKIANVCSKRIFHLFLALALAGSAKKHNKHSAPTLACGVCLVNRAPKRAYDICHWPSCCCFSASIANTRSFFTRLSRSLSRSLL